MTDTTKSQGYEDNLKVSGKFDLQETTLDPFTFINNSLMTFDLSGISFADESRNILKIIFSLYPGDKRVLTKPIQTKRPSIGVKKSSWCVFTQTVCFPEEYMTGEIVITVYDYSSEFATIKIPYSVFLQSISEIGGEFDLVTANLRNDSLASYVARQKSTDTLIVFQEKL